MTNDPDSSQAPGDTECIPRSAPSAGNFADQSAILSELSSATPQRALSLLLVDQHRRWQSGARVSAESYLESAPVLNNDPEAAVALIYSEYLLREMLGERPSRDEFFSRFPQHAERLRVQFELHQALAHSASVEAVQHSLPSANLRVVRDSLPDVPGCVRMELLGRGGMGVVYRAWQPRLKRHVAVKMIRDAVLAGPEQRQRFQAEAQAVARLQHANIVQIFEIGEVAGRMFLVLEYVGGGNLATRLAAQPQPHTEAAELVEVLARAIHHAHERGVVHRDLKPANILMSASRDSDGRERQTPKITDFGLAKFTEEGASLAETGGIVGTPSYMAPEQAAGGATTVGAAADVYALGAILYEMLTGRPPFQAPTPLLTMELARTQEPVPPTRLQPKLPRDLETICLKCLRKEPDQRYSSAADLAEDLRRFRAGEPIRARPIGWARRSVKWARRRPAAAALIAVTVMSACVLLGVWIGFTQRLRGEVKQKEFERQRAFETYAASRRAMRQTLDKVREDPRIKDGPMNDLLFTIQKGEAEFYRAFVDLRADDMNYRAERAQALYELANLSFQWTSREETLGLFQEAIAELERLEQEQPSRIEHRVEWANAQMKLGTYFLTTHQLIEAERPFIRALDRLSELWDAHPERIDVRKRLAHGHRSLGMMRQMQQRPEEAEGLYQKAIGIYEDLQRERTPTPDDVASLGLLYKDLAILFARMHRDDAARRTYDQARLKFESAIAAKPTPQHKLFLAQNLFHLGELDYYANAKNTEAVLARSRDLFEAALESMPFDDANHYMLGSVYLMLATVYSGSARAKEVEQSLLRARDILAKCVKQAPCQEAKDKLASAHDQLGDLYWRERRVEEAQREYGAANMLLSSLDDEYPGSRANAVHLGKTCYNLGQIDWVQNKETALAWFDKAVKSLTADRPRGVDEMEVAARSYLLNAYKGRANCLEKVGKFPEAARDWRSVIAADKGDNRPAYLARLAYVLAKTPARSEARSAAQDALQYEAKLPAVSRFELARAFARVSAAATGDPGLDAAERSRIAGTDAAQAVKLLETLRTSKFFAAAGSRKALDDDDFTGLKSRPDFQAFLKRLDEPSPTPAPPEKPAK